MDDHYQTGHSSTKVMAEILLRAAWVSVGADGGISAIASQGKFVPRGSFTQSSTEALFFLRGGMSYQTSQPGGKVVGLRVVDKTAGSSFGRVYDEREVICERIIFYKNTTQRRQVFVCFNL